MMTATVTNGVTNVVYVTTVPAPMTVASVPNVAIASVAGV